MEAGLSRSNTLSLNSRRKRAQGTRPLWGTGRRAKGGDRTRGNPRLRSLSPAAPAASPEATRSPSSRTVAAAQGRSCCLMLARKGTGTGGPKCHLPSERQRPPFTGAERELGEHWQEAGAVTLDAQPPRGTGGPCQSLASSSSPGGGDGGRPQARGLRERGGWRDAGHPRGWGG